jgi:hypothetical protein
MATTDKSLWWYLLIFTCILAWIVVLGGCDDTTPPEMRYLGPPVIEAMNRTGNPRYLDAWRLGPNDYAEWAAFGWKVTYYWKNTDELYAEPGMRTTITITDFSLPPWSPKLGASVTGSGSFGTNAPDSITCTSRPDGHTNFYLTLHDWPSDNHLANTVVVMFTTRGMEELLGTPQMGSFGQEMSHSFYEPDGGLDGSWQDWALLPTGRSLSMSSSASTSPPPEPNFMPMDLGPVPLPKVFVGDIQPALVECALSEAYPPSGDPNADDEGILIHSRWMKVRAESGEWGISPAPFITLLPYDSNDVTSIAEAAWPYTICFHAPAESEGMVAVNAKLSIVDPNGVSLTAIDIIVHEVGQCPNCGGWLWRSDYILPLAGVATGPLLTWAGDVLVCWLPPGHTMKLRPPGKVAMLATLSPKWLAVSSILDRNGDGIVNFIDFGVLLGME